MASAAPMSVQLRPDRRAASTQRCRSSRASSATKCAAVMASLNSSATSPVKGGRSEEHTSELQSLMRISYAVFCLKKKKENNNITVKSTRRRNNNKKKYVIKIMSEQ